jgi:hypothetical protein
MTANKQKQRYVRPEDAFDFLLNAYFAPSGSKLRQDYLEGAVTAYVFGLFNKHSFKVRGDRRGRPPGGKVETIVKELEALVDKGDKPTTAARKVLRARGFKGVTKGRADYLVRLRRQRKKTNI